MPKRTSGEGTLYKTKRGNYRAQIIINGRRRSKTADTARECRKWLREQRDRLNSSIDIDRARMPLNQFLDDWLLTVSNNNRPSTTTRYESLLRLYVRSDVGDITMEDLKSEMLQRTVDQLCAEHKATVIRGAYGVLKNALNHAVRLKILEYNPMDGVILPRQKKKSGKKLQVWDENQVQTYLITIDNSDMMNAVMLKLAVGTGMRLAELLALMWKDIDFGKQEINIVRQSMTIHRKHPNDTAPPKTESSIRTIRVGKSLISDLIHQNKKTDFGKAYFGWKENVFCFPNKSGDILSAPHALNMHRRIIKKANLPYIKFHDLRHTAISLMLKQGLPITEVSRYVGHSRTTTTLDVYGHFLPTWTSQVAAAMDEILTPVAIKVSR